MFGQNDADGCFFVPHPEMYNTANFSRTVKSDFSADDPYVLRLLFHLTRNSNGENILGVTEDDFMRAVARLNIEFNQFNIFFKYNGIKCLDDDAFVVVGPTWTELRDEVIDTGNYDDESINLFVAPIGNAAYFQYSDVFCKYTNFKSETNTSIIHEMGHALSLLHIFDGTLPSTDFIYDNLPLCDDNPLPRLAIPKFDPTPVYPDTYPTSPENVTRDPNNQYYNADEAGDFVIDTSAAFWSYKQHACVDYSSNPHVKYFVADPRIVDEVGEMYVDLVDEINNFLDYLDLDGLRDHFSDGQGVRMREAIENDIFGVLQQKLTTIASLYEPYEGVYFTSGNYLEYLANPPHFQPGFDYYFVECGDGSNEQYVSPTPYGQTFSYTTIIVHSQPKTDLTGRVKHPNHSAIRINQSDNSIPHKCWNNWNKSASSGSITKFNDGVINTNVTIYPKDSLQINDSNLIPDLINGLYKIDKQYNDGSQEQNIIIKNNE